MGHRVGVSQRRITREHAKEVDVTASLFAAVASVAVLGMCFSPTRAIGIAATAFIVFLHPWLLLLVAALFYFLKLRK